MNCSKPEVPCDGLVYLRESFGSFSTGYGRDRTYGFGKNCTWVIAPETVNTYGLPTVIVIKNFNTESAFDVMTVYEGDFISPDHVVASFDGKIPGGQYALPEMVVIPSDKGATINFVSDLTTSMSGFTIM